MPLSARAHSNSCTRSAAGELMGKSQADRSAYIREELIDLPVYERIGRERVLIDLVPNVLLLRQSL